MGYRLEKARRKENRSEMVAQRKVEGQEEKEAHAGGFMSDDILLSAHRAIYPLKGIK